MFTSYVSCAAAQEIQRQDKARLLPGGSQTLIKVAQKHEREKQQLAALQRAQCFPSSRAPAPARPVHRRYSDSGMLLGRQPSRPSPGRRNSEWGGGAGGGAPLRDLPRPEPVRPALQWSGAQLELAAAPADPRNTSTDSTETLKVTFRHAPWQIKR